MRRSIVSFAASLVLAALMLGLTWGRSPLNWLKEDGPLVIRVITQPLPSRKVLEHYLGPFRLEGAWQLASDNIAFFGYSALVPRENGRLLAINDAGGALWFAPPGARPERPLAHDVQLSGKDRPKEERDVESATYDPTTRRYWLGLEGTNRIVRTDARLNQTAQVDPRAMAHWGINTGAEAMARLADGRFVVIREVGPSWRESRLHEAVLFAGDPIVHPDGEPFFFDGPDNFSVVDMALLPDGRALILMRRLLWIAPMRFAGRIVIADTARIRAGGVWHSAPLASLASVLPVDNFEAIAAVPGADGRITVWIMSDDNNMRIAQRTLLWKLSVDPAHLPWPR